MSSLARGRLSQGSVLISLVAMLFATLLVATPTLAFLTHPQEHAPIAPRPTLTVSAFA